VVFANQAMADITGYSVDELVAFSPEQVYALVHPDDREAVWGRYRRRMAGEATLQRYEFRSLCKDGGVRWLEAHASLIEYAGRPAVQAAYMDITSRKRAEESLRASEDRYRSLFDNAVLGIYRTTPDGRILAANPALLRMLGYDSLEDLTQRNLEEEGFEAGYPRSLFKELLESRGEVIGLESAWTRRDGTTVHIRESAVAIRDEAGNSRYYEGTVEDISDRKQAEAARKLSHRVLEISNRSTMREPMLQQIVLEIRDFAQCENVAIRILDEDGNIPYEAFVGFSREFYERESPLSVQRDHCMCIRVI
jgi:PAS domain S-box-containing protein